MKHQHHNHFINSDINAKKTLIVIIITLFTMFAEITFGFFTNSMALLSDGWHMGTHALALLITFFAFVFMKKYHNSPIFPNGTYKISSLSGYTSSLFLALTGLFVFYESIVRFFHPINIFFNTAILVAIIGLVVNGLCLLIMESHQKNNQDYNFKAAYLHILTDAMTSIFAIIALLAGKFFGLYFLDPFMGIVGGSLILKWSFSLIKQTSLELLDINCKHKNYPDEHNHCFTH